MKYDAGHRSANVEDRRGSGGRRGGPPVKIGLVGVVLLVGISLYTGQDFVTPFLGGSSGGPSSGAAVGSPPAGDDETVSFVSFVLDDAQRTFGQVLGPRYRDARLVLFSNAVETACGSADSGVGPFYCPGDSRVYLDLSFFSELRRRFGAPGDFAQAYVIAHELGHHVQNLLGTEARMRAAQRANPDQENSLSVMMELQADCYAGVWAHTTQQRQLLESGDVEEGMRAASAVGDDTLQRAATGTVRPETWTHGSSAQRVEWFRRGFETGDLAQCDTFGGAI